MGSSLIINAAGRETRVALVENGHIAEFYLERKKDRGIVGNIYRGRVTRVLPGMQAAFVDIGQDRTAFLYVADVLFDPELTRQQFELTEGEQDDNVPEVPDEVAAAEDAHKFVSGESGEAAASPSASDSLASAALVAPTEPPHEASAEVAFAPSGEMLVQQVVVPSPLAIDAAPHATRPPEGASPPETVPTSRISGVEGTATRTSFSRQFSDRKSGAHRREAKIEDLLKAGQEVLVQVSKDPIGTKGARVTCHISIPGRHLVFMPTVDHVGISRRIGNEKERRRLREIVDRMRPQGTGFIVRTVAEKVPQPVLEADIRFLIEVWNETVRKSEKVGRIGLLHADLDLILRATRDLFAHDVDQLIIDDRDEFERVQTFVVAQDPSLKERIIFHAEEAPIFDAYGIEGEIRRASARKVWLKSGGHIIIDQAEALTAVDVNSGRYVGQKNLEDTITKINVEAAKEIVFQLRLRNIGGIIICDFIDMEKQQNRDRVFKALVEVLGRDKAYTNVLRISELGLVEMTRKRVRESIGRILHEDCGYCGGQGYVKTATTVAYEIFQELRRTAPAHKDPTMVIQAQSEVAELLLGAERAELRHLMDRFNKSIQVRSRQDYHREQYDIYSRPVSGVEILMATAEAVHDEQTYAAVRRKEPRGESGERSNDRHRGSKGKNRQRQSPRNAGSALAAKESPEP